jgi:hypothetical protein
VCGTAVRWQMGMHMEGSAWALPAVHKTAGVRWRGDLLSFNVAMETNSVANEDQIRTVLRGIGNSCGSGPEPTRIEAPGRGMHVQ